LSAVFDGPKVKFIAKFFWDVYIFYNFFSAGILEIHVAISRSGVIIGSLYGQRRFSGKNCNEATSNNLLKF
jgi:hypothetical protein